MKIRHPVGGGIVLESILAQPSPEIFVFFSMKIEQFFIALDDLQVLMTTSDNEKRSSDSFASTL